MQRSPELQFIFDVLNKAHNDRKPTPHPNLDWDTLFQLALRHRVWHQVYEALAPMKPDIPSLFYDRLGNYCRQDALQILNITAETKRLAEALNAERLLHCFIKGVVLNAHIYDGLTQRPCKDIDVWVHPDDHPKARNILLSLGYQQTLPTYVLKGHQEQYYMRHHNDIEFYHSDRKIIVELHFKLEYFGVHFFPITEEIQLPVSIFNTQVITLQDDYHLLYLMLHGSVHAWTRLRWVNDIVVYLKSGKVDLDRVMMLARKIDCEHIVEQSLLLIKLTIGEKDRFSSQITTTSSQRGVSLAKSAALFIQTDFELTRNYSVYNRMFYYYRFYLTKIAPPKQRLKVFFSDLFKVDRLFPYVRFPAYLAFMYYILYPIWVIKLFIKR